LCFGSPDFNNWIFFRSMLKRFILCQIFITCGLSNQDHR
jgi:hypothetical protein